LADTAIDIRRVAWHPLPGLGFSNAPLSPGDFWDKESFDPDWTTAPQEAPMSYLQSAEPPLSFDVDRIPPVVGDYEVLSVNAGSALSTSAASLLGIPDDWSWVVKFGALADLLSRESNAKDPLRADYCNKRYDQGLALLGQASAVLSLRLNNIPLPIDAVRNGDDFNPGWQASAAAPPTSAYVAGLNLIGFGPKPDAVPYSVTASVVQNAPLPANSAALLQVGRDDYDSVLDYAQHLAAFKMGGSNFTDTLPLFQSFLNRAALYNSKLKQLGFFTRPMYEVSQLESERNPVYDTVSPKDSQQ
jgi:hypothetical protein